MQDENLIKWGLRSSEHRAQRLAERLDQFRHAVAADAERLRRLSQSHATLLRQRAELANLVYKFAIGGSVTDDDYRLYASARINGRAMAEVIGLSPDEGKMKVFQIAEEAFGEIKDMGASADLVTEIRKNFTDSITLTQGASK